MEVIEEVYDELTLDNITTGFNLDSSTTSYTLDSNTIRSDSFEFQDPVIIYFIILYKQLGVMAFINQSD
jgi:hypothetical protein